MKKTISLYSILAALLIFIGCGVNSGRTSSSGADLNADFFNQEIKGELTISAYDSMLYRNYLEEAARSFEAKYPGTKINIETFSSMPEVRSSEQGNNRMTAVQVQNDPQGRSDYLSRVNTNIMSGTGADIYAMDVLPLHKFSESGTLENLEPYMNLDPLFNRNDYRQNILEALRYNNGVWFLPMDYTFNYFAYDSTLLPVNTAGSFGADKSWSTEQLFELGVPLYNGNYKLFNAMDFVRGPTSGMFGQLLNENIQNFISLEKERANFQDGSFANLLTSVKEYGQGGYIPQGITGQQNAGQVMQRTMAAPTDRFFFKLNSNTSLIGQFSRDMGVMMRMQSGAAAPGIDSDDEIAGIQASAGNLVPFEYNQAFGINSQSKNKALAWAFIKFLLSGEMQLSTNIMASGLPLNNAARAEKAELTFSSFLQGRALNDQQRAIVENYKTAVETLSDSINTFVVQDTSINDMITQDVQYFFDGSRTANEVARVIQNKADLYLSE